jgi:hypothetical protein
VAQAELDNGEGAQTEELAGGVERVEVATQAGAEEEAAGVEGGVGGVSAVLERLRERSRLRWTSREVEVAVRLAEIERVRERLRVVERERDAELEAERLAPGTRDEARRGEGNMDLEDEQAREREEEEERERARAREWERRAREREWEREREREQERERELEREREREREREDAATFGMRLAQGAGRWGEDVRGAGAASAGDENGENVSDIQGELETMRKKLCARAWTYVCMLFFVSLDFAFGGAIGFWCRTFDLHESTRGLERYFSNV